MDKQVIRFSKKLMKHELIAGSTYYFIGSMVGNVFAFLFNLFIARKLSPLDYGIYASLISFFTLAILIPQSFLSTIIQFATKYFSKNDIDHAKKLYWYATEFLSIFGIVLFIIICISANAIGNFLHVSNVWLIISVGMLIVISFISSANLAYLQSLLKFGFISFIQALGAVAKLLFGILFIFLGFKIFGAITAVAISFIVPFLLTFIPLKFLFAPMHKKTSVPSKEILAYALPAMITTIALSSFVTTDVILAKHFLSGYEAGLYAGLSLLGKVIFYFTAIIPTVMFPILIRKYTKGYAVHRTFYMGLLLVGIPSILLTVFYFLFPTFVITLFLGKKDYLSASGDIGFMALFLTFYSLITVMANFFLSLKQTKVVYPVVAMAILQIVLISAFHMTITHIIMDSLLVTGALIILLSIYYIYHHTIVKSYSPELQIPQEIQ